MRERSQRDGVKVRILVSFEPAYLAYQGVIAAAIRVLRPGTEVETTTLDALGEAIERFDPQLVICSRPNTLDQGGRIAWVELSIHSIRPSKICVNGRHSESAIPTLDVLLMVIDEVDRYIRANIPDVRSC